MTEATSGFVTFKPRARLIKLIGEELISDEVVAITELVKNAHDADASTATLVFKGVNGPDGEIHVIDDGCGMDHEIFLGGWMEPAGSTKTGPAGRVTRRGRRVLGEKGVGRFAADKLGRHLDLVSRRVGHSAEVCAQFDWDDFDSEGSSLSEIKNRWEIRPAAEIKQQGTILRIRGLRAQWSERLFRRLSTRLARLQSPFGKKHGFTVRIESDEYPEYSGELRSAFLEKAPYSVELDFDGRDSFKLSVGGKTRSEPAGAHTGQLSCGPVKVRLHAFDLETEAIARIGPRMEVRAWLREWSGVSVYRDAFRIWPYGEPHDDWLRLDQRRVNNPVVCLSNNQVVGFVEIGRDSNSELVDQTNREGLVHNQAFADLRRIIEHAFQVLEAARQKIRHPADGRGSGSRRRRPLEVPIADVMDRIASISDGKTGRDLRKLATDARQAFESSRADVDRLVDGYNDLAAVGQAAIGLGTHLERLVAEMRSDLRSVAGPARGGRSGASMRRVLDKLDQMERWVTTLSDVSSGGSHRRRTMDVGAELEGFAAVAAGLAKAHRATIAVVPGSRELIRVDMNPHSFRRVLHCLLSNSFDWLIRTDDAGVTIESRSAGSSCEILFSDNGPGIRKEHTNKIFEPMFSTKEGGRGMGLTIARKLVEQHGGSMEVVVDGRRRGSRFRILLPRKRSRATVHG